MVNALLQRLQLVMLALCIVSSPVASAGTVQLTPPGSSLDLFLYDGSGLNLSFAEPTWAETGRDVATWIELGTAVARAALIPLEERLANDASRTAELKKALISLVRLVNQTMHILRMPTGDHTHDLLWSIVDAEEMMRHIYRALRTAPGAAEPLQGEKPWWEPALNQTPATGTKRVYSHACLEGALGFFSCFTFHDSDESREVHQDERSIDFGCRASISFLRALRCYNHAKEGSWQQKALAALLASHVLHMIYKFGGTEFESVEEGRFRVGPRPDMPGYQPWPHSRENMDHWHAMNHLVAPRPPAPHDPWEPLPAPAHRPPAPPAPGAQNQPQPELVFGVDRGRDGQDIPGLRLANMNHLTVECPCCQALFHDIEDEPERLITVWPCGHMAHRSCAERWFAGRGYQTCITCRVAAPWHRLMTYEVDFPAVRATRVQE
ncbi:E3 ubiquitin-protein ligase [bacterium]|nr:E3 ubiquitin-protein ligase [bacterium]